MNKFYTILKNEYLQVVKKKSFVVGIILTPIFLMVVTFLPAMFATKGVSTVQNYSIIDLDGTGIAEEFAESINRYKLDGDTTTQTYQLSEIYSVTPGDESRLDSLRSELDSALVQKTLKNYLVFYPDIEKTDSAVMVSKSLSFKTAGRFDWSISNILSKRRLGQSNINIPVDSVLAMSRRIEMIQTSPGGKTRDFMTVYFGAFVFIMIVFISVFGFGQILMRSVIEEKNSRIMEVLVSSVSPFQLMMGKVVGLGLANLTQVAIWLIIGLILFLFRGATMMPAEIAGVVFNPILIAYFVIFLILAYILFATLFAFIGSICTTDKEAQNFMFPIVMSLMLPVFLMMYIIQEPDSTATTILSFIPFLSPTMMVARLNIIAPETFTFSDPIILEATIGVVLTAATAIFMVWLTSRVFRVGILMYGKRPTLPEIIKWVRYK